MAVDRALGPDFQHAVTKVKSINAETVESRIGYRFQDRSILVRALTHASALENTDDHGDTYQRLEFLGDRVLGLVIAEMLYAAFPEAPEGELARRFNQLVKQETCAGVALEVDLGHAMIVGEGEAQSGGRRKRPLLADICESVIAALYLDGGYPVARRFIEEHWAERMRSWTGPLRDAKTTLQEWSQARGLEPPHYEIAERTGPDHAPEFTVRVEVIGFAAASGRGGSRRQGEQAAATAFLQREGVWKEKADD